MLLQEQQQAQARQQQMLLQEQQQSQARQQQMLLQEQQQSQARQLLLEQLLQSQMHDSGHGLSRVDAARTNNAFDQVLLKQKILHELQQRSLHPSRHVDPSSLGHIIQAKFGQMPHQGHQNDLLELVSRSKHGQMRSLEHQILQQEQLHARQMPLGLRQQMEVEEERRMGSVWPVDETNQFLRSPAGANRAHTTGFGSLDFYQQQQRPSIEDQLSQFEQNLPMQDRFQRGLYDPGLSPFERSMPLPVGGPGVNLDFVNAMARSQGLDIQEPNVRMLSASQVVGGFSSGIPSHQPLVPNQFHASQSDIIGGCWSDEVNGQPPNNWMESRIRQLHLNAELQNRESDVNMTSEDPSLWMSAGTNDDSSKRLLMELLHRKSGQQSTDSLDLSNGMSYDRRAASGRYSGTSSSNQSFSLIPDQEAGIDETSQVVYSNMISDSSMERDFLNMERKRQGFRSEVGRIKELASELQEGMAEQAGMADIDRGEMPINVISRHNSLGVTGGNAALYNAKIGLHDSFAEEAAHDRVPAIPSKSLDNFLLKRPLVSSNSSSQEGLSELVSDPVMRGKIPLASVSCEGEGQEPGGYASNQSPDRLTSGKDDVRYRRTSSGSDADVSEPSSFIDMLKSNAKKPSQPEGSESLDGTQASRSGKKKGKKGRQIDPALLGFKVTSNRIMMGEIQRIDD
ncbi:hypothetical protein U1Q18_017337 [Sarracenia purpurea var. burkii]